MMGCELHVNSGRPHALALKGGAVGGCCVALNEFTPGTAGQAGRL